MAKPVLVFDKAINSLVRSYYAPVKGIEAPYYKFVEPYVKKLTSLSDNRLDLRRIIGRIKDNKSLSEKLLKANFSAFTEYADEIIETMKNDESMLKDVRIKFDMTSLQQPRIRIELESEAVLTMFTLKYAI